MATRASEPDWEQRTITPNQHYCLCRQVLHFRRQIADLAVRRWAREEKDRIDAETRQELADLEAEERQPGSHKKPR